MCNFQISSVAFKILYNHPKQDKQQTKQLDWHLSAGIVHIYFIYLAFSELLDSSALVFAGNIQ